MSGQERRFSYRTAVLLSILALVTAMLVQQRAMADDTQPALARIAPPEPSVLVLPTPAPAPALASPLEQPKRTAQLRSPGKRVIMMEVTAYCPCKRCCGPEAQGVTASGRRVSHNRGAFVAADTDVLPFETRLSIPGYRAGKVVPVIDRGGDIKGNRLDVFFASHSEAKKFGRRHVPVTVYEN